MTIYYHRLKMQSTNRWNIPLVRASFEFVGITSIVLANRTVYLLFSSGMLVREKKVTDDKIKKKLSPTCNSELNLE